MTTLAHSLANALASHVDHAFGLMGNGNAQLIDAFAAIDLPFTAVRHEAATVASADAYTRISGKLSLATTTYGAGFSNTLTALAEAAQARTPLLLVVGDAPETGKRPWDIDQEMAAAAVGVRTYELGITKLKATVDRAVASAIRHKRPVVIAIPSGLATRELPADPQPEDQEIDLNDPATMRDLLAATMPHRAAAATVHAVRPATAATSTEIARAVQTLAEAKRSVVIAGRGAWLAEASQALDHIARQLDALTATTALARGIFSETDFDLGVTGGFGQEAAMQLLSTADVVLVVGASLNQFTMRFGELFGEGTSVVRVDTDQVSAPVSVHDISHQLLRGDALSILETLSEHLAAARSAGAGWRAEVRGLEPGGALRTRDAGDALTDGRCEDGRLDPRAVAARIADLLPADRHVTSDGGHFIAWANMFWPVSSPERMIMVGTAYQTIGLGFATVAGVAAAAPESTTVVTTGDGGALMALADLETTIRTTKSCVIVVWNDAAYGAELHLYGTLGLDENAMLIPEVDFASLATALGAVGVRVESLGDLDALARWKDAGAEGTLLLDCRVSRSVIAPYQFEVQRQHGIVTPNRTEA